MGFSGSQFLTGHDAHFRCRSRPGISTRRATAADVLVDAFEQVQETLCTGIDDAGLAQYGELVRRIRQCGTACRKRVGESRAQVIDTLVAGLPQRSRKRTDHRKHGALARLGDRLTGLAGTEIGGIGQRAQGQALMRAEDFAEALQELRKDRPGVAARAIDGLARHAFENRPGMVAAHVSQGLADTGQGEAEIAAGIAIRNRKHVDAVEQITLGDDPANTCNPGLLEHATISVRVDSGCHRLTEWRKVNGV